MNCENLRNRILAHSHPSRMPSDLRRHLVSCPECRRFADTANRLDELLPLLPVPNSDAARAVLLDKIMTDAPIIVPHSLPTSSPTQFERWFRRSGWKIASGIAAAVVLSVGIWWSGSRTTPDELAAKPYVRHELLQREVAHVADLATADTPPKRLKVWADVVADLNKEAGEVYQIAPETEFRALGRMFDKAIRDGIIKQADRFPEHISPTERADVLKAVKAKLQTAEADATNLIPTAPPPSKAVLRQMATTAREGLARVEALQ